MHMIRTFKKFCRFVKIYTLKQLYNEVIPFEEAIIKLTGAPRETIDKYIKEFYASTDFLFDYNKRLAEYRNAWEGFSFKPRYVFIYVMTRLVKPKIFVETGVFDGASSSVILLAMKRNDFGTLYSVDLPAIEKPCFGMRYVTDATSDFLPKGQTSGWAIPSLLRDRFVLVLGDSRDVLPKIVEDLEEIDIFMHYSLHTFDCQYTEYTTIWNKLITNGYLFSDDIYLNMAFKKFAKTKQQFYYNIRDFGVLKKIEIK